MDFDVDSSREELPLLDAERLDRLADDFEQAFESGEQPLIEHFLADCSLPRQQVLHELILLECELRRRRGLDPDEADYLRRFPDERRVVMSALQNCNLPRQIATEKERSESDDSLPGTIGRYVIKRLLGCGGFGRVYLALDPHLDRTVAIKVPLKDQFPDRIQVDDFIREAKSAARLKHHALVAVFDVQVESGQPYIVYEYFDGQDLASWASTRQLAYAEIVELAIFIADGLRHAHQNGVIHCDLKLANVLIDKEGHPHIADFGLALLESASDRERQRSGTPAMMAPEQIRGLRHQLDSRTDIWALGVMLYELLCGRRPFSAASREQLFEQIQFHEPLRPQQIDENLPDDLDRICMRCLSKRRSGRYQSADELMSDLRSWLDDVQTGDLPQQVAHPDAGEFISRVVPRGLRPFGGEDQGFFLHLLPGPRNRTGLPESVSFWKQQLEETNSSKTFSIGLIYGPSGSGKTSLVNAGIIPRLNKEKLIVISATADALSTEARVLQALGESLPDVSKELSLSGFLSAISKAGLPRKVVLFIDQFEQWLSSQRDFCRSELVDALRHCDGTHVQAVVLVRDEFFTSVNLLFQEWEEPLREGLNYALVPRFSEQHAAHVLTLFGQAYGALPTVLEDEHREFLNLAVKQLADEGGVIGVRLALFAVLVQSRPWLPATLDELGGAEGVGVAFLEESFGSQANPTYRVHQRAIRQVLQALLPPTGSQLRLAKTVDQLRLTADCDHDQAWNEIVRILDHELRVITPVDPIADATTSNHAPLPVTYQLGHDYLVPLLRAWLNKKQHETRRGRAELKLEELASMWGAAPSRRFLPSFLEWLELSTLTRRQSWTRTQAAMMSKANWRHLSRLSLLFLVCGFLVGALWVNSHVQRAASLHDRIVTAQLTSFPALTLEVEELAFWAVPRLKAKASEYPPESDEYLRLNLAMASVDHTLSEYLVQRANGASANEVRAISEVCYLQDSKTREQLWQHALSDDYRGQKLLCVTSLLAKADPVNQRNWSAVSEKLAEAMVDQGGLFASTWTELHRPARQFLLVPLGNIFRDKASSGPTQVKLATQVLVDYAGDDVDFLCNLLLDSSDEQFGDIFPALAKHSTQVVSSLQRKTQTEAQFTSLDTAYKRDWREISSDVSAEISQANGVLTENWAFCQTMQLNTFHQIANALRDFGYRPTHCRPYAADETVLVAAVWKRDQSSWQVESGLTKEEVSGRDEFHRDQGRVPVDIAGYMTGKGEQVAERFSVLWSEESSEFRNAELYVAIPESEQWKTERVLAKQQKKFTNSLQCYVDHQGIRRYCAVHSTAPPSSRTRKNITATQLQRHEDLDRIHWDVSIVESILPQSSQTYYQLLLDDWKKEGTRDSEFDPARFLLELGTAHFHLGNWDDAIANCGRFTRNRPEAREMYKLCGIAHAKNGEYDDALQNLANYQRLSTSPIKSASANAIILSYFGEEAPSLQELERRLKSNEQEIDALYFAAESYAACAESYTDRDPEKSDEYAQRSISLLEAMIEAGYSDLVDIQRNSYLDSIRHLPEFAELTGNLRNRLVYATVMSTSQTVESVAVHGFSPQAHLERCRELQADGYRPFAIGVTETESGNAAASVWHRPLVSEAEKERVASRKANAAIAEFLLGRPEAVWRSLQFAPDPRLRNMVIHRLAPLGCDAAILIKHLMKVTQPDLRRVLILALGQYPKQQVASNELQNDLLDMFRSESDCSVRSAAEWLLRSWGLADDLEKIDLELATGIVPADRNWYRTKTNGHTLAVVHGPVHFLRGMTPAELTPVQLAVNAHRRMRINRSFAIATKEVTVEQFEQFMKERGISSFGFEPQCSWNPQCAAGGPDWKHAIEYCIWLSDKEGIPEDQLCYPRTDAHFPEAFQLPSDYLSRGGYRLPTAAEWEYACKAGTTTMRYFGQSEALLSNYAWYLDNSQDRCQPVGTLKPNDLGLFDMHGNVAEWIQERWHQTYLLEEIGDDMEDQALLDKGAFRMTRDSSFRGVAANISSSRTGARTPYSGSPTVGFRIARTIQE